MRRGLFIAAILAGLPAPFVAVAQGGPAPAAAPHVLGAPLSAGQPIPVAELEPFVDGAVRQALAADHVAGAAVAVVQSGQPVLEKGYGLARAWPAAPVDPRTTLFRLGSISKTFTWIAVLKAVEAGRMDLNRPINAYLPKALQVPDEGFAETVRLRDLMAHAGGFEEPELGVLFVKEPKRLMPLERALQRQRPHRVRAPGELSSYSNYGAALAGAAAARVASRPFEDLVQAEVLNPLGLAGVSFRQPYPPAEGLPAPMDAATAARLSESYLWTAEGRRRLPIELVAFAPAAAASGSADDMARYMLALLADGRTPGGLAYGPQTAARIRTELRRPAPGLEGWTHGFMEYALPGGYRGIGHDGATLGFRARLLVVPELGLGIYVAGNTDTAERLVERLPAAIVARFYGSAATAAPSYDPAAVRQAAAGQTGLYLTSRRAYHGLEAMVDRLTRTTRVSVGDDGRLAVASARGAALYAPDGAAGRYRALDGEARIAFTPPGARARAFFLPGGLGAAERVGPLQQPALLGAVAALAMAAALLVLAGLLIRERRDGRETGPQLRSGRLEAAAAGLWLAGATGLGVWLAGARDPASLMYDWPNPWLVAGSSCGLLAGLASLVLAVQWRRIWPAERRVVGWTVGRKLRHTATVLLFAALTVILIGWGALEPWSS